MCAEWFCFDDERLFLKLTNDLKTDELNSVSPWSHLACHCAQSAQSAQSILGASSMESGDQVALTHQIPRDLFS
jgi:hypothetical protein